MKLNQALDYGEPRVGHYAYEVYTQNGGRVLDYDKYLKIHKTGIKPWAVVEKEKEIKKKIKKSKEAVSKELLNHFFKRKL